MWSTCLWKSNIKLSHLKWVMVKAIYKNKPNVYYCKHPIIKWFYLSIILTNCARIYHKSPILNFIFYRRKAKYHILYNFYALGSILGNGSNFLFFSFCWEQGEGSMNRRMKREPTQMVQLECIQSWAIGTQNWPICQRQIEPSWA